MLTLGSSPVSRLEVLHGPFSGGGQCAPDLHSSWGLRRALCPAVPSPPLFPALQRPCLGLHHPCPSYHAQLGSCLLTLSLALAPRARLAIQDLLAVACLCFLLLPLLHLPLTQEDVSQGTRVWGAVVVPCPESLISSCLLISTARQCFSAACKAQIPEAKSHFCPCFPPSILWVPTWLWLPPWFLHACPELSIVNTAGVWNWRDLRWPTALVLEQDPVLSKQPVCMCT